MKRYIWNILIWLTQGLNTLGGPVFNYCYHGSLDGPFGYPDEATSSVIGKIRRAHGGTVPKGEHPVVYWLDRILEKLDRNHTLDSIEDDEGTFV